LAERRGYELSVPLGIFGRRIEAGSGGLFAAIMLERIGGEQVRLRFGRCIQLARLPSVPLVIGAKLASVRIMDRDWLSTANRAMHESER
jgi:hypothetical protein